MHQKAFQCSWMKVVQAGRKRWREDKKDTSIKLKRAATMIGKIRNDPADLVVIKNYTSTECKEIGCNMALRK